MDYSRAEWEEPTIDWKDNYGSEAETISLEQVLRLSGIDSKEVEHRSEDVEYYDKEEPQNESV